MELNDYLSSLNENLLNKLNEINKREKDILSHLCDSDRTVGTEQPVSDAPVRKIEKQVLPRLIHDDRLEESSKSKLGTFEKIYNEIFTEATDLPIASYGFDELDFSPLVNPLMSIIEIELNRSLYQEIRRLFGIDMSRYYFRNAPSKQVTVDGRTYQLGSQKMMLGGLYMLISSCRNELGAHVTDMEQFVRLLAKVIDVRNGASHGSYVGKDRFLSFYESYSGLYNDNICSLMELKERLSGCSSSQSRLFAYGDYEIPLCDYNEEDDYIRSLTDEISFDRQCTRQGILMTDCSRLAMKYSGDISAADEIRRCFLKSVIPAYKEVGVSYRLFDVNDGFAGYVEDPSDWQGYHKALYAFCRENNISTVEPMGLFIIGGNDVIPMPKVENPTKTGHGVMEETVDADILYSYDDDAVRIYGENRLETGHFLNSIGRPCFYVGRLPLENGMMMTSFADDILGYFGRAVSAHGEGGVKIESPFFTTCHRAQKCGKQLVDGFPVRKLSEQENIFVDNMAVSPLVMLECEKQDVADSGIIKDMSASDEVIDTAFEKYMKTLSSSDMLIFFLHGGYNPAFPVYSGDAIKWNDQSDENERITPAVFAPWMLKSDNVNIKSIAAVSCYGARFIDYARNDSALLTAIHTDTLLFYGSSRIAFGPFDDCLDYFNGKIVWSLVQMREYLKRLFAGIPAGEAINHAKQHYLRTSGEHDERCRTTVLEFNVFGDPLLNIHKMTDYIKDDPTDDLPEFVFDERCDRTYETVYSSENKEGKGSLLQRIRGMVDKNMEGIHKEIADRLYRQFSLKPRDLYTVWHYKDGYGNSGYSYCYRHPSEAFDSYTFVETDKEGTVKSKFETI